MFLRLFTFGLCLAWLCPSAFAAFDHSHAKWTSVLSKYRTPAGLVRYQVLKQDRYPGSRHLFDEYLSDLALVKKAEYDAWSKDEKIAFLINSYNAFTIKLVADNYPLKSIKDLGGLFSSPWKKEFFTLLEGKIKSLDPIEQEYLRKELAEPRVHAALNCASLSCPKLAARAYTAKNLQQELDTAFHEWLKDDSRNHFDSAKNTMELSKIFDWYKEDFVKAYGGIPGALQRFGPPLAKSLVKTNAVVKYLPYDWRLNDASDSTLTSKP